MALVQFVLLHLTLAYSVDCYSYQNESKVRSDVFADYSDAIRPVLNQNDTVNVHFTLELLNIESLDVRTQTLSSTIWVVVKWVDEKIAWDSSKYDGVTKFFVHEGDENKDIWKPDISVSNTIDEFAKLGSADIPIVVKNTGEIVMEAGKVIKTHCEIDMTYYPFDSQACEIIIGAWVYSTEEVNMTTDSVNLDNYRENGEWEISSASVERREVVFDTVPQSVLWFTLNFHRRRPFFVMHLILPMLFLSILNVIVFVLPPDAGEKMSLAITNLLSFAVFLTLFSEQMPHSSRHTPIISVYLATTFIISVFTVVVSAIVLRLHFREGPVPRRLSQFYCGCLAKVMCYRKSCCPACNPANVHLGVPIDANPNGPKETAEAWSPAKDSQSNMEVEHIIDWKTIASITDWLSFLVFLIATGVVGFVVIIRLSVEQ